MAESFEFLSLLFCSSGPVTL